MGRLKDQGSSAVVATLVQSTDRSNDVEWLVNGDQIAVGINSSEAKAKFSQVRSTAICFPPRRFHPNEH